jgi:hypothetical protein
LAVTFLTSVFAEASAWPTWSCKWYVHIYIFVGITRNSRPTCRSRPLHTLHLTPSQHIPPPRRTSFKILLLHMPHYKSLCSCLK